MKLLNCSLSKLNKKVGNCLPVILSLAVYYLCSRDAGLVSKSNFNFQVLHLLRFCIRWNNKYSTILLSRENARILECIDQTIQTARKMIGINMEINALLKLRAPLSIRKKTFANIIFIIINHCLFSAG